MRKEYTDAFLSDEEKLAVRLFAENDLQKHAVKKILLAGLYENGTLVEGQKPNFKVNSALSLINSDEAAGYPQVITNEQLGQKLRAYWEALKIIENGFDTVAMYEEPEPANKKPKVNGAR